MIVLLEYNCIGIIAWNYRKLCLRKYYSMNFKKLRTLAACLAALCLAAFPVLAEDADVKNEQAAVQEETQAVLGGEGTAESPYLVADADGLEYVAQLAAEGKTKGVYFKLENDITLNDVSVFEMTEGYLSSAKENAAVFTPVGTTSAPFEGTFDGDGHYITGLYCKDSTEAGLFGVVRNGVIVNLNLDFALVDAKEYAGALAGKLEGASKIENVVVSGSVIGKEQVLSSVVGGLTGVVSEEAQVVDSVFYGAVSASNAFSANAGGIAGINKGTIDKCNFGGKAFGTSMYFSANVGGITASNHGTVSGCRSQGTVGVETAGEVNDGYAGGVAGYTDGEIYGCKNDSTVTGYCASYGDSICAIGGVAGYVKNSEVYLCSNDGKIVGEQGTYAGGVAGLSVVDNGEHKIYDCLNNGEVSSAYGVGGGILGRISVSGYVTNKNELLTSVNTADVSGQVSGGAVGVVYEDSASVVVENCYYPAGQADGAEEGSASVADAGFTSGSALAGLGTAWKFESGKMPELVFADGLAKSTSTITAEKTQSFNGNQTVTATGVGTMSVSKTIVPGTYDVIVRFTGDENSFAPAPVIVTVTVIEIYDKLEIKSVDTSALTLSDGTLSGKLSVGIASPEAGKSYTAVCGIFVDGVLKTTGFAPVTTVNGLASFEVAVASVTVSEGQTVEVNALLIENTENLSPVCENIKVTIE